MKNGWRFTKKIDGAGVVAKNYYSLGKLNVKILNICGVVVK